MKRFYLLLALVLTVLSSQGQVQIQRPPEKTRMLFLLDASGSMYANWGNSVRMDVAKNMLAELVDSLKVDKQLELALRVYGHQYNLRYKNCQDSKLEVPFAPNNHDRLMAKLRQIQPSGVTPIAYSLEQAANDFTNDPEYRNVVIIITDGIESCGGDPCAVSLALQEKNIFLKPFVIGLGMDKDYRDEFACVGQYYDARNVNDFRQVLNKVLKQSLETTTVSVELLDHQKRPSETNVNVTFYNNFTKSPIYDFVHFRDAQGRPDSVVLDAVLSYDVVVNTIPPVVKRNIVFEGGKHNVLPIQAPQGNLLLSQKGHTEYAGGVRALIRQNNKQEILNVQEVSTAEKYLMGTYDVEVLTLPKTYLKDVKIQQGETTRLAIPGPGVLNANIVTQGYGSIYKVHDNGFQEWIYDLEKDKTRFTLALQPGKYKMVFRAERSFGSKYTEVKEFTIATGSTVSVKFFGL
ncbi:VWA domain-containing protein [Porifericola rhodea]|uniref:vWA domain-containing protein n=1 Tax=Porifericola rhodea TaxID=930972 RepID=UPI002666EED5|nr:VWA domain-containing protein [Porifericola rhodea]WKN30436.1 VWA domain-containing protein [Porifericola rhodea]